jgi:ubiquinone/menaquinone biosynthesis C-methylase UbiE
VSCCYDILMKPLEYWWLGRARAELVGSLDGTILDLGAGSGANFRYFSQPDQVTAVEPDADMRKVASSRKPPGLTIIDGSAEQMNLPSDSFDHVVSGLVLCSVQGVKESLEEIHRVLKFDGTLHFLEHVRGEGLAGRVQDWLTPLWSRAASGCHLDRRTVESLEEHGFEVESCHLIVRILGLPFVAGRARRVG